MKKASQAISVLLVVVLLTGSLCLPVFSANEEMAVPTTSTVYVDGQPVSFQAYNINGSNYIKLRDIAMALNKSAKQFDVGYSEVSKAITLIPGKAYTPVGGELTNMGSGSAQVAASPSASAVYINGLPLNLTAYNIGGYNYFKLRDVGAALNFSVIWVGLNNTIRIVTSVGYSTQKDYGDLFKNLLGKDINAVEAALGEPLSVNSNQYNDVLTYAGFYLILNKLDVFRVNGSVIDGIGKGDVIRIVVNSEAVNIYGTHLNMSRTGVEAIVGAPQEDYSSFCFYYLKSPWVVEYGYDRTNKLTSIWFGIPEI